MSTLRTWTCNAMDEFDNVCGFPNRHSGSRCARAMCPSRDCNVQHRQRQDSSIALSRRRRKSKPTHSIKKSPKTPKHEAEHKNNHNTVTPVTPKRRIHKYSKKKRSKTKSRTNHVESFEFIFNYPNAHRPLFGDEYIPLIQHQECDENVMSFIDQKLRHNDENVTRIDRFVDGLDCSLYKHQQFGVGWLIFMEQNPHYRGGFLCDEMGVGKTIQIIALMLLTKNDPRHAVQFDDDQMYEYVDDFSDHSLDDFIVDDDDDITIDEAYINEDDERTESESETSNIVCMNPKKRKFKSVDVGHKPKRATKRRKLTTQNHNHIHHPSSEDEVWTQILNEHDLNESRQLKKQRTLIVVPLCILAQWKQEIKDKAPDQFDICLYHGAQRKKTYPPKALLKYDIVITTYTIIALDYNRGNDEHYADTLFSHKMNYFFYRMVLDEAHIIKNSDGWTSRAVAVLGRRVSRMRIVLTGTPIQNGLCDLFALSRFLQLPQCDTMRRFKDALCISEKTERFAKDEPQYAERETRMRLLSYLSVVMLRRLKSEVIDNLVSKTEEWIEVELNAETRELYDQYEETARKKLEEAIALDTVRENWVCLFEKLMRLRQICSNPDIAKKSQGFCEYCRDILDAPYKVKECGHMFCAEHLEAVDGVCPQSQCEVRFDDDDLIDLPDKKPLFAEKWRRIIDAHSTKCDGYIARKNGHKVEPRDAFVVRRRITKAKGRFMQDIEAINDADDADIKCGVSDELHLKEKVEWNGECEEDTMDGYDGALIQEPYDFTLIPSVKTMMMIEKIMWIREHRPNDKILIYSQWTSMLDLIGLVLGKHEIEFYRYDGKMKYDERKEILNKFKEFDDRKVLLISLKCGALGLNLMCANHVIFVDLWWNPAVEAQAIDRVHRIGQEKHVFITRLVIKDSVQDRMLNIQLMKQETADFALNGAKLLKSNRMNINTLRTLFGSDL
eukprot:101390_1